MKLLPEQYAELEDRLSQLYLEEAALRRLYKAEKARMSQAVVNQGSDIFGNPLEAQAGMFAVPVCVQTCQRKLDELKNKRATVADRIKRTQKQLRSAEIVEQGRLAI